MKYSFEFPPLYRCASPRHLQYALPILAELHPILATALEPSHL
jgi:hypothetical protein